MFKFSPIFILAEKVRFSPCIPETKSNTISRNEGEKITYYGPGFVVLPNSSTHTNNTLY